jgi:phenylalanyl-tRNA synthetase beta chain
LGGELAKTIMDLYSHPIKERRINFEVENINRILGSELGYKEIEECFEKMGFSVTGNSVLIPSFRRDVNGEIDLVEEVARFRGYGSFPVERPIRRVEESDMVSVLRKTLSALGFNEAYSLSFMNPRHNFSPERIPIQLQNPINKELSVLRTSLLPGLLQIAETNISRGVRDIRLYELGTIFTLQNEKVIEKKLLSGILTGKREPQELYCKEDVGFSDVKGIVESFLEAIEIEKLSFFSLSSPLFSSGTGCGINIDSTYIGQLGEVRTDISREFGIERPYFFELEIKKLISHKRYRKLFTSLARFPSISRDISLIIDNELISSSLVKSVKEEGIRWLEDVKIFDYYSGDKIPREKKALGIRMVFRSPDRTLTSYEVDEEVKRIVENLQEKYGVFERHI